MVLTVSNHHAEVKHSLDIFSIQCICSGISLHWQYFCMAQTAIHLFSMTMMSPVGTAPQYVYPCFVIVVTHCIQTLLK